MGDKYDNSDAAAERDLVSEEAQLDLCDCGGEHWAETCPYAGLALSEGDRHRMSISLHDLFPLVHLEAALEQGYVRRQSHPELPLSILNYTEKCAYDRAWNPVTLQCRGLIYETGTLRVVARPFPKFFNYGEPSAPELDLDAPAQVYDKMDGSLGILYPTEWHSSDAGPAPVEWAIATRGSFVSEQAIWATDWFQRFADRSLFDPSLTYLFEILVGWNRIVCDYDWEGLVLLAILDTATGRSLDLPEDSRLLQARSPRDDARERLGASDEGLEDVRGLPSRESPPRSGAEPLAAGGVSEDVERGERGAPASAASEVSSEDPGRAERGETGEADFDHVRGTKLCNVGQAKTMRQLEEETGLRELPPHPDAFRVVDRFPYVTLADALKAEPRPNAEGYVVYFPDLDQRVKVKQSDYVALHRILTGTNARHVYEFAAVRACSDAVARIAEGRDEGKLWATFVGLDPARVEQLVAAGDDWLTDTGIPDEFYDWVRGVIDSCEALAVQTIQAAFSVARAASEIADRSERFRYVNEHSPVGMSTATMRLASVGGRAEMDGVVLRAWRLAEPAPAAPFQRSEAVA